MKSRTKASVIGIILFGTMASPGQLAAQASAKHHHYKLIDMGTFGGSLSSINMAVGNSFSCSDGSLHHAVLWENGSVIDLNGVIPAGSPLQLVAANDINDRGEIAGEGVPPDVVPSNFSTQGHAFLLIPCDENHPDVEGCDYNRVVPDAAIQTNTSAETQEPAAAIRATANAALSGRMATIRVRFANRYRGFGILQPATK